MIVELKHKNGAVEELDLPDDSTDEEIKKVLDKRYRERLHEEGVGAIHSFAQPLTFNLSDEIAGGVAAIADDAKGYLKNLFRTVTGHDNVDYGPAYTEARDKARQSMESFKESMPEATNALTFAGSALNPLNRGRNVLALSAKAGANELLSQAGGGEGGLSERIDSQAVSRGAEAAGTTLATDMLLNMAGKRVLKPFIERSAKGVDPAHSENLRRALDLDAELMPSQRMDPGRPGFLESNLKDMYHSSVPFLEGARKNARRATEVAARQIGLPPKGNILKDDIADAAAKNRLLYDAAERAGRVTLDSQFGNRIVRAARKMDEDVVPPDTKKRVEEIALRILQRAGGDIDGKEFVDWFQQLNTEAKRLSKVDFAGAQVIREMQDELVNAAARSPNYSPSGARSLKEATSLYRNRMLIESVLDGQGQVDLAKLSKRLKKVDPEGYTRGANTSDLYEWARLSEGFDHKNVTDINKWSGHPGVVSQGYVRGIDTLLNMLGIPQRYYNNPYRPNVAGAVSPVVQGLLQGRDVYGDEEGQENPLFFLPESR